MGVIQSLIFDVRQGGKIQGGTQIWVGQGCAAGASNPYPSLRVIWQKRVPIFKVFSSKIGPFFKNFVIFRVFAMPKTWKFGLSQKSWPMFKDFLVKNGTHVWGFLVKKRPIRAAHRRLAKYVSTPWGWNLHSIFNFWGEICRIVKHMHLKCWCGCRD